jgi:hypothetical protein
MVVHPDLRGEETFLEREFTEVTLDLADGRSVRRRVDRIANHGSRGRPADLATVRRKFDDCAAFAAGSRRAGEAFDLLAEPERLDDVRVAMERLR